MSCILQWRSGCVLSILMLVCRVTTVRANQAIASTSDPIATANVGTGATTSLYAYSYRLTPNGLQFGPNATVTVSLTSNGTPATTAPNVANSEFKIPVPVPGQPGTFAYYGNTVALKDQAKSLMVKPDDQELLQSASSLHRGYARQFVTDTGTLQIQAYAIGLGSPNGKAAGAAYDPFIVPGGATYTYAPAVDASVECDDTSSFASAMAYAVDSTTFTSDDLDNFPEDGAPMNQTLWFVGVSADGPIASVSDLGIDFELNPLALNEISFPTTYLSMLPGYSPTLSAAQLAVLIDAQIDGTLEQPGVITISDGTASISDYSLFPDGTTFTPFNGQDVEYGDGANAAEEEVPEPGAVGLLVLALPLIASRPSRKANG
jgi:hypothetical protein